MLEKFLGNAGQYVIPILLLLALIALVAWLLRQVGAGRRGLSGLARNRQPRLGLLDHINVDARRKLVLIRRDNVEHLILIGGPTDVVVEMNIVRATQLTPLGRGTRPDDAGGEALGAEPIEIDRRPDTRMPRIERTDPQYVEMAKKLEAAMTKPAENEAPMPRPMAAAPLAPLEPRVALSPPAAPMEPRVLVSPPAAPVEPRVMVSPPAAPIPPEPRVVPEPIIAPRQEQRIEPRAPEPRPMPVAPQPAPAPTYAPEAAAKSKPDQLLSLEEEMASLLRPGSRPQ